MQIKLLSLVVLLALLGSCGDSGYNRSYIISNSSQEPVAESEPSQR